MNQEVFAAVASALDRGEHRPDERNNQDSVDRHGAFLHSLAV